MRQLKISGGQIPRVKLKFSGREEPLVKLEPSVGQETRFGCEIEDCGSGEEQSGILICQTSWVQSERLC